MPVINTGVIGLDAVDNVVAHLEAGRLSYLGASVSGGVTIYDYPAYEFGKAGPAISVELGDGGFRAVEIETGGQHLFDWGIDLRIFYFTEFLDARNAHRDAISVLSLMAKYLLQNPRPNEYGNLLVAPNGIGPQLGLLPVKAEGRQLFGGSIVMTLVLPELLTLS